MARQRLVADLVHFARSWWSMGAEAKVGTAVGAALLGAVLVKTIGPWTVGGVGLVAYACHLIVRGRGDPSERKPERTPEPEQHEQHVPESRDEEPERHQERIGAEGEDVRILKDIHEAPNEEPHPLRPRACEAGKDEYYMPLRVSGEEIYCYSPTYFIGDDGVQRIHAFDERDQEIILRTNTDGSLEWEQPRRDEKQKPGWWISLKGFWLRMVHGRQDKAVSGNRPRAQSEQKPVRAIGDK